MDYVPWQKQPESTQSYLVRRLVRPKSVSNPVRRNGTRADASYSCTSGTCTGGFVGVVSKLNGSTQAYRNQTANYRASANLNPPSLTLADRLLSDVRNRTLSGIGSDVMQMNAALLELGGTVRAVRDYYRHLSRGVRSMFKDFPKHTQERLKGVPPYRWTDVPSDYLGYLYGVAPLADDIANGANQLSGMAKREMAFGYTVKGGAYRDEQFSLMLTAGRDVYNIRVPATRRSYARVGYYFEFPRWWIEEVPVVTPFSTAYELTRMSFVLDWVAPWGNYIGALEAMQFLPYFRQGFEVRGAVEQTGNITSYQPGGSTWTPTLNSSDVHFFYRSQTMNRTAFGPLDGQTVFTKLRVPELRWELGLSQASQAMALATQRFHNPPSSWFRSESAAGTKRNRHKSF